jgi:hypothetical protein
MGRILVLGAAFVALFVGCKHDNTLKPPKEDPVYRLPPDDPRYSQLPKYPDNTMNKFPKRDAPGLDDGPGRMPLTRVPGTGAGGGIPGQ